MVNKVLNLDLVYAVVGLGVTGISCIEFLIAHNCKNIIAIDSVASAKQAAEYIKIAALEQEYPHIQWQFGNLNIPQHTEVALLSPGIAQNRAEIVAARQYGNVEIINDIELFARLATKPVIAITGANGKSTVATMVAHLAQQCGIKVGLGGNIGIPALSLLGADYELYVLELSSFQLELVNSLHSVASTVLNVTPDHMDRYDSFADYKEAKLRIYRQAEIVVFNRHDTATWPLQLTQSQVNANGSSSMPKADDLSCKRQTSESQGAHTKCMTEVSDSSEQSQKLICEEYISFGLDAPQGSNNFGIITVANERYLARGDVKLLATKDFPLLGDQNLLNILAALALTTAVGLDLRQCVAASKSFVGLTHRCELIGEYNQLRWIDDSKGTNVGATIAAIEGTAAQTAGKIVIILGGESKGADFTPLVAVVEKYCRAAILIGKAKQELFDLLHDVLPCHLVQDMASCVEVAAKVAKKHDSVLLSPACASLDMFTNYKARGAAFKQAVLAMVDA